MAGDESVGAVGVNHVGLCVRDLDVARRFYESVFGFTVARSLSVPDGPTGTLLRLSGPIGLTAVYLERDGFVLELLWYAARSVAGRERVMDEAGLTHLSLSVPAASWDGVLARVEQFGGAVLGDSLIDGVAVFVRDPDGQLLELLVR